MKDSGSTIDTVISRVREKVNSLPLEYPIILIPAVIILTRVPYLLQHPRIWAEEGSVYLAGAFANGFSSLFDAYYFGYLNLYANLASYISTLVPLEQVPYVTMASALVVQIIPFGIVAFGKSVLWHDRFSKVFVSLILLYTLPNAEIWLCSASSQFFFGIITFLILLEPATGISTVKKWFSRIVLFIGGLSGVMSIYMVPLYAFKTWRGRQKERLIQTTVLTAGLMIQGVIFLNNAANSSAQGRFSGISFTEYAFLHWNNNIVLPLLGTNIANKHAAFLTGLKEGAGTAFHFTGAVIFITLLAVYILFSRYIYKNSDHISRTQNEPVGFEDIHIIFIAAIIFISAGIYIPMQPPKWIMIYAFPGQRYYYVPNVIFILFMAGPVLICGIKKRILPLLSVIILLSSLTVGIKDYYSKAIYEREWPVWEEEIKKWKSEENKTEINIWPPGWKMILPKK